MITITARGHPHVLATHPTTLEITASEELTTNGDCIVAVGAVFDPDQIAAFLKQAHRIRIAIDLDGDVIAFHAHANPDFDDDEELVFRRSEFNSARTVGVKSSMACVDLPRDFVQKLKNPKQQVLIHLEEAAEH